MQHDASRTAALDARADGRAMTRGATSRQGRTRSRDELILTHLTAIAEAQAHVMQARHVLTEARAHIVRARQALTEAVLAARRDEVSWAAIGRTLGVTRQATYQRWHRLEPEHLRRRPGK
jgi:hypothetical protein